MTALEAMSDPVIFALSVLFIMWVISLVLRYMSPIGIEFEYKGFTYVGSWKVRGYTFACAIVYQKHYAKVPYFTSAFSESDGEKIDKVFYNYIFEEMSNDVFVEWCKDNLFALDYYNCTGSHIEWPFCYMPGDLRKSEIILEGQFNQINPQELKLLN